MGVKRVRTSLHPWAIFMEGPSSWKGHLLHGLHDFHGQSFPELGFRLKFYKPNVQ